MCKRAPPWPRSRPASSPAAQRPRRGSEHLLRADLQSHRRFTAYQLDLFGKVRNLTRAAQDQYFASRQARDAAQITLVSEVAADYLAVGSDRALLKIAEDALKSGTESWT